jgi:hypothetical protein
MTTKRCENECSGKNENMDQKNQTTIGHEFLSKRREMMHSSERRQGIDFLETLSGKSMSRTAFQISLTSKGFLRLGKSQIGFEPPRPIL